MGARFSSLVERHIGRHPEITTFRRALQGERTALRLVNRDDTKEKLIKGLLGRALPKVDQLKLSELLRLQKLGITPNVSAPAGSSEKRLDELQTEVRLSALNISRLPDGSVELLGKDDYLAMTPYTPYIGGQTGWRQDQLLIRSPQELLALAQEGIQELQGNTACPGVATAALGMPIGGVASRALKFAAEHPELFKNRADEYITNLH